MKRLLKFLRLVLGDFACDVVLPILVTAACFALVWFALGVVGEAAIYWFGFDPVRDRQGEEANWLLGALLMMAAILVVMLGFALASLYNWLHRKWQQAGQPE